MELKRAYQKYKSFGGVRLLKEYYRMGVLGMLMKALANCIWHGRSLKSVYPIVTERVGGRLKDEIWKGCYSPDDVKTKTKKTADEAIVDGGLISSVKNRKSKVWFCWLQGMESAPEMVKVCYESVCRYLPEKDVVVIDERNYKEYVVVPEFIIEKYRKGIIPAALFSDILRLELLIKYGGTWIDSTVLMTDPATLPTSLKGRGSDAEPGHPWLDEVMDAELFMFQYYTQDKRFAGIGNWFITSRPEHWALKTVRDTLYEYWRLYNCVVDYYIFHRVFGWIAEERPEVVKEMPRRRAVPSLYLRDRLAVDYDEAFWQELTSHVCLHKLNYRKEIEAKTNGRSYWNEILNNN